MLSQENLQSLRLLLVASEILNSCCICMYNFMTDYDVCRCYFYIKFGNIQEWGRGIMGDPSVPPSSVLIPAGAYIVFWIINTCFVDCRSLIDCYQVASTEIKGKSASYIFFFHYLYPIMSVTVLLNVCMICLK